MLVNLYSFATLRRSQLARFRPNTIHSVHVKRKLPLALFRVRLGRRRRTMTKTARNSQRLIPVVVVVVVSQLILRRKSEARFPKGERNKSGRRKPKPRSDTSKTRRASVDYRDQEKRQYRQVSVRGHVLKRTESMRLLIILDEKLLFVSPNLPRAQNSILVLWVRTAHLPYAPFPIPISATGRRVERGKKHVFSINYTRASRIWPTFYTHQLQHHAHVLCLLSEGPVSMPL